MISDSSMNTSASISVFRRVRFAYGTALFLLLLGLEVIVGWYARLPVLTQVFPGFVPMQFNTALLFLMTSVMIWSLVSSRRRTTYAMGTAIGVLAALTLAQYLFDVSLGIDQLFFRPYLVIETAHPGRMAAQTALCFLLVALANLFTLRSGADARWSYVASALMIPVGYFSALALLAYAFGVRASFGWTYLSKMAVHTATGFLVIAVCVVVLNFPVKGANLRRLKHALVFYSLSGAFCIASLSANVGLLAPFARLEDLARSETSRSATIASFTTTQWLTSVKERLAQLSRELPSVNSSADYEEEKAMLQRALATDPVIAGACRTHGGETCVAKAGEAIPSTLLEPILSHADIPALSAPLTIVGEPMFVLASPFTVGPTFGGTNVILSRMRSLAEIFTGLQIPSGQKVFLVGEQFGKRTALSLTAGEKGFALVDIPQFIALEEAVSKGLKGMSGVEETDASVSPAFLAGYAPVSGAPWAIVVMTDASAAYSDIRPRLLSILGLTILFALASGASMVLLLKPLSDSLVGRAEGSAK